MVRTRGLPLLPVLALLACLGVVCSGQERERKRVAVGNLAVVFNQKTAMSTHSHPLKAYAGTLWCQAVENKVPAELEYATFTRVRDGTKFRATIEPDTWKATHEVGSNPLIDASKYRCSMKVQGGEMVHGNMFAYSRPFIHSNGSLHLESEAGHPYRVVGDMLSMTEGDTIHILCPAYGFPEPTIEWYKDDVKLESTARVTFNKYDIMLENIDKTDEGVYKCVATNVFEPAVDATAVPYSVTLSQRLNISSSLAWVYPLAVIVIILLLLFIIIYACSCAKRYKHDNYNVAKREKFLHGDQDLRRLNDDIEK